MIPVDDAIRNAARKIVRHCCDPDSGSPEEVDALAHAEKTIGDLVETVQRSQWREMDSAPKDGTEILILTPEQYARSVAWDCGGWWLGDLNYEATHWMPIPAPPQTREET